MHIFASKYWWTCTYLQLSQHFYYYWFSRHHFFFLMVLLMLFHYFILNLKISWPRWKRAFSLTTHTLVILTMDIVIIDSYKGCVPMKHFDGTEWRLHTTTTIRFIIIVLIKTLQSLFKELKIWIHIILIYHFEKP